MAAIIMIQTTHSSAQYQRLVSVVLALTGLKNVAPSKLV
ncbi:hypothetical protein JCM19233_2955 [Vibrio astriarenae]|nr:hypothetical protein JCM19233_2955 [Vibrio sp. C7]